MSTHILIPRAWFTPEWDAFFGNEKYSRGAAYIWLLAHAGEKQQVIKYSGKTFLIEKGEVGITSRILANNWRWKPSKVLIFLYNLHDEGMIKFRRRGKALLIIKPLPPEEWNIR